MNMTPEMYTFFVWSLVVGFVPVGYTGPSCDKFGMILGSCEIVIGPAVTCSKQLYDRVLLIKQLLQRVPISSTHIHASEYNDTKYLSLAAYNLKTAVDNVIHFVADSEKQNDSKETCIAIDVLERWTQTLDAYLRKSLPYLYWMEFFFPILGTTIFIFGMVGNLIIVVMYFRHKDLQTHPNKVVVNLAISDIFLLIYNIPWIYGTRRWMNDETITTCHWALTYLSIIIIGVCVYSMVLLSLLRYLATSSTPGSRTQLFLRSRTGIVVLLVVIWVLAAVIGADVALGSILKFPARLRLTLLILRVVFLCPLPLVVITVFSILTSRILRKRIPGEQISVMFYETRKRKRGANVILSFVIIFCITHVPNNIIVFIKEFNNFGYLFAVILLTTMNSCLNPVGLFVGSRNFRNHLKTYLTELKSKISEESEQKSGEYSPGDSV